MMEDFQIYMIKYTANLINTLQNKNKMYNEKEIRLSDVYDEATNSTILTTALLAFFVGVYCHVANAS